MLTHCGTEKRETERLYLVPLNIEQLKLWATNISNLEKQLNCIYRAEPLDNIFLKIIDKQIEIIKKDEINNRYYTFWFLIRKTDNFIVGSISLKNPPNLKGEVEIGYGLGKAFKHKGYMTEAVKSICKWEIKQKGVISIIAETEINNKASQNVLKRCRFINYKKENTYWWKLN